MCLTRQLSDSGTMGGSSLQTQGSQLQRALRQKKSALSASTAWARRTLSLKVGTTCFQYDYVRHCLSDGLPADGYTRHTALPGPAPCCQHLPVIGDILFQPWLRSWSRRVGSPCFMWAVVMSERSVAGARTVCPGGSSSWETAHTHQPQMPKADASQWCSWLLQTALCSQVTCPINCGMLASSTAL